MKSHNKSVRLSSKEQIQSLKKYDKRFNENSKHYGITNWMVGTCEYPWSPWIQIHIGYFSIQIKWYLIVIMLILLSFITGILL